MHEIEHNFYFFSSTCGLAPAKGHLPGRGAVGNIDRLPTHNPLRAPPPARKPGRQAPLHPPGPARTIENKEQNIETNSQKRKRGGQPGNTNALKHGFYSHRFRNIELSDLDSALSDGLVDEIALLRVIIRRVFEYADSGDQDLDAWTQTLNTLGAASTRLAGLIRTQQVISGNGGDVVDVLSQAIGEVAHDLGLSDPASN